MKLKIWLFKKKKADYLILGKVFFVFMVFVQLFELALHHLPTELYRIKEEAATDIDFSDIYYQVYRKEKMKVDTPGIVLVNTGSVSKKFNRHVLNNIMEKIAGCKPRAIGIDMIFEDTAKEKEEIKKLDSFIKKKNIVIGADFETSSLFKSDSNGIVNFGYINLPGEEGKTVRNYHNYFYKDSTKSKDSLYPNTDKDTKKDTIISFARKLYDISKAIKTNTTKLPETFLLKYSSLEAGCYDINNPFIRKEDTMYNFPAIEATALLLQNEDELKKMFDDKIVIIGWLGNDSMGNLYDIQDRHRVPVDFHLFNRLPTMPGAAIHANALRQMLNGKKLKEVHPIVFYSILGVIVFIYLFIFLIALERIRPIGLRLMLEILFLLLAAFFIIWLSAALMTVSYYINAGKILLYIALLIEFKMFACQFEDYLEKRKHSITVKTKHYINIKEIS